MIKLTLEIWDVILLHFFGRLLLRYWDTKLSWSAEKTKKTFRSFLLEKTSGTWRYLIYSLPDHKIGETRQSDHYVNSINWNQNCWQSFVRVIKTLNLASQFYTKAFAILGLRSLLNFLFAMNSGRQYLSAASSPKAAIILVYAIRTPLALDHPWKSEANSLLRL